MSDLNGFYNLDGEDPTEQQGHRRPSGWGEDEACCRGTSRWSSGISCRRASCGTCWSREPAGLSSVDAPRTWLRVQDISSPDNAVDSARPATRQLRVLQSLATYDDLPLTRQADRNDLSPVHGIAGNL